MCFDTNHTSYFYVSNDLNDIHVGFLTASCCSEMTNAIKIKHIYGGLPFLQVGYLSNKVKIS